MNIVPELYAPIVREKFEGRLKLGALAAKLGYLNGTVGDTVHFPKFKTLSDSEVMVQGTSLTFDSLEQTDSTAKIKQIGKGVIVYDIVDATAFGTHVQAAAEQQGIVFARAVDLDLAAEARTSPLKVASADAKFVTYREIDEALGLFGDEQDVTDFTDGGIVINSLTLSNVYQWENFISLDKTTAVVGNGVIKNGLVGYYRGGIPVYIADAAGTYDPVTQEICTYILKSNALAYMVKRDINIETQRDIGLKATKVAGDLMYACKLVNESGCVYIKKTL